MGCWTFVVPNVFLSSSHDVLEGGDYNIFILRLSKFWSFFFFVMGQIKILTIKKKKNFENPHNKLAQVTEYTTIINNHLMIPMLLGRGINLT